jgi:hypothetical protein
MPTVNTEMSKPVIILLYIYVYSYLIGFLKSMSTLNSYVKDTIHYFTCKVYYTFDCG